MEKKIEQYLPLYIGQKARMLYPKKQEWKESVITPEFLFQHEQLQWETKLILRPLSSMTEEEKLELYKIINPRSIEDEDYMRSITIDELIENKFQLFKLTEIAEGIQWLLSKGFDIFGLKEKGLALYPEDL